jgi:hypothetical protein
MNAENVNHALKNEMCLKMNFDSNFVLNGRSYVVIGNV